MDQKMRVLKIIHGSIAAGPAIFAIIAYINSGGNPSDTPLRFVAFIAAMAAIPFSFIVFKLFPYNKNEQGSDKFAKYNTNKIMQWAVLEGAAFINIIAYYIGRYMDNLLIGGALIIAIIFARPGVKEFENRMDVKVHEKYSADAE